MKKILLLVLFASAPFLMNAQCFVQVQHTDENCFGDCTGTTTCFPVGTGPYSWLWAPGGQTTQNLTGLCAGTYTVTMTDLSNGCVATATVTINQPSPVSAVCSNVPASCSSCCDGSAFVSASGGTAGYTFSWAPGGQVTSTITNLCPGSYTCCVTDANGCMACCTTTVSFSTGVNDPSSIGNLSVYPSPATQFVTLDETFANATSSEISLSNVLGETVYTKTSESTIKIHDTIDLSALPDGIYFIRVKTNSGITIRRFIKQ